MQNIRVILLEGCFTNYVLGLMFELNCHLLIQ